MCTVCQTMILGNRYEANNVADKKMLWRSFHFRLGRQIASGAGGLWKKPSGDWTEFWGGEK